MITKFKFFDKEIIVDPINVGQYVRIIEGDETVYIDIFGEVGILMCKRQQENALKILLGGYKAKDFKTLFKGHKSTKKPKQDDLITKDFNILEGKIMRELNQQRSEIRKWEFLYFIKMYEDLPVINQSVTYEEHKNKNKPDKKAFKELEKSL